MSTTRRDPRALSISKSTLLVEWDDGHGDKRETYRLIARAERTPGYEDEFIIEKLATDGMGEPSWWRVYSWQKLNEDSTVALLMGALKSLLADQRQRASAPPIAPMDEQRTPCRACGDQPLGIGEQCRACGRSGM